MKKLDGFDDAMFGVASVWQRDEEGGSTQIDTLIYDGDAIIGILMTRDNMTFEEAAEYVDFNILNAYVGEDTPLIAWSVGWEALEDPSGDEDDDEDL